MTTRWQRRPFWTKKLGQIARLIAESYRTPLTGTPRQPVAPASDALAVMFLGHSSFLISLAARHILIDPVFSTRLILLRRQRRAGVTIASLPPIDLVLLTHAHMDHLDRPTLRRVARATRRLTGQGPVVIVPPGVEDLVANLGFHEIRTLDWWQSASLLDLHITATPCKHWGARLFRDVNRGFGGYVIAAAGNSVYHSGDSAYFPGFCEIGLRLAPQIALLPIGAYFPDSYRAVHTSPEEALQAFLDLRAEAMIPMHFGTFRLGREPMDEPPVRLLAEARRLGIEPRMHVLAEGETELFAFASTPAPALVQPVNSA